MPQTRQFLAYIETMHAQLRRFIQRSALALACAALLSASLHAAPLAVRKVSAPSGLHPLTMAIGGRMLTTASSAPNSFGGKNYTYQWPGCYFRAAFKGSRVYFRIVRGREILHVVVDGQPVGSLTKPAAGVYEVDGLSKGRHAITVFVATEMQDAPNTFGGFAIPRGEKALTPAHRTRQIEFIGDSHTVGYGDLSNTRACTDTQVWYRTDDTRAFGPLTARHFHADYQVNAISGRGVVRNYDGFKADTLPEAYPYILFNKKQKYDDPAWHPQVIVIALGTNDFTTALNPGEPWKTRAALHADFQKHYVQFLESLRARNPHAYIIVWATNMANGEIEAQVHKVVEQLKQKGFTNITYLPINNLAFGACNSHPTLADEHIISGRLIQLIDAHKNVWKR